MAATVRSCHISDTMAMAALSTQLLCAMNMLLPTRMLERVAATQLEEVDLKNTQLTASRWRCYYPAR